MIPAAAILIAIAGPGMMIAGQVLAASMSSLDRDAPKEEFRVELVKALRMSHYGLALTCSGVLVATIALLHFISSLEDIVLQSICLLIIFGGVAIYSMILMRVADDRRGISDLGYMASNIPTVAGALIPPAFFLLIGY